MLTDRHGRIVTDLRISVTRRCNFRCVYCHDEGQGPVLRPTARVPEEMTPEHVERIVRVGAGFDVRSVKFTGGEPLLRTDLVEIVERTRRHVEDVSLTTNGAFLADQAASLAAAGLRRINVSVDSLDPDEFRDLRKGHLEPVLDGIRAAIAAGLRPVKLNMVVMKRTLPRLPDMIRHIGASEGALVLQLIEFMPEIIGHRDWMVDILEVKAALESEAERVEVRSMHHRSIYHIHGAQVEVVDPVHNAEFCFNCRRVRVTHDGCLKGCLNRDDDHVSTAGLDDDGVREAFGKVVENRVPYYGVHVQDYPRRRPSSWPGSRESAPSRSLAQGPAAP